MRLPIESAHKTAGYLTLVPAYGRDYKSKREVMEAWDAGKDFIVQDMMSPYDGKPINKSDAKAGGISNVNIRYKRMRSVAVIKVAKFPEGKKMTVDEVAEVVGPEFKEMNEDPPESVKKVRKDMEEAMDADLLPVERAAAGRLQGEDLYDALKKIVDEKQYAKVNGQMVDLFSASGMVQLADAINEKNRARFLSMPIEKMHSLTFKMLKSGSDQQAEKLEAEAEANEAQAEADRQKADAARMKESAGGLYGYTKGTQSDVEATIRKAQRQASKLAKALHGQDSQTMDFLRVHAKRANSKTARLLLALMHEYPQVDLLPIEQIKQAENTPMGMYGYPSGTARLALDACSALRSGIGEVAYNLHSRRMAKHDRITGFLKDHSKAAKCGYTRLLLDTYPESPRLAAKKKIPDALKKHQFTKDDNPNPKGNDKDGDGKSGEKPDFLKEIEDKKGKKASLRRAAEIPSNKRDFISEYHEYLDALEETGSPDVEKTIAKMWKENERWAREAEKTHKPRRASINGQMLRKAFVPDSVDGWLEWADGTRTAAGKISPAEIKKKIADMENFLRKLKDYDPFLRGPIHHSYQGVLDQVKGLQKALDEHEGSSKRAFRRA